MRYILLFFWLCTDGTWQINPELNFISDIFNQMIMIWEFCLTKRSWPPSNFMKKVNILFFKYYGFPQLKFLEDKDMKYAN